MMERVIEAEREVILASTPASSFLTRLSHIGKSELHKPVPQVSRMYL